MNINKSVTIAAVVMLIAISTFAQSTARIPIRDPLTSDRTYYVRTDGNDNNSGLLNDSANAVLTIQHAVDLVSQDLDLAGHSVTIQVGTGAYNAPVVLTRCVGTKKVTLQGDASTPSNVTITLSSGTPISVDDGAIWKVRGFKLSTTAGGYNCLETTNNSTTYFDSIDFGACSGIHIWANKNCTISTSGNYTISGGAQYHLGVFHGAYVEIATLAASRTVTLVGTPSFSGAFALVLRNATILADQGALTFSGSATGKRYVVVLNGVLDSNGGGTTFFPGNSAGLVATGGQYQ